MILKSHEYRLYPTWKQRFQLKHHFGCNRYTYNAFIEICQKHYENGNPLSYFDMTAMLTKMKRDPELKWLNSANAQSLNAALKNLSMAFRNLSEGRTQYPKRKNRHGQQSIQYPHGVKIKGKYIYIPKIGWIRFRDRRSIEGKIKTVTLSKNAAGEYHASILFEIDTAIPKPKQKLKEQEVLGVDFGITPFAATSDGEIIFNPRHYVRNESNLRRKQKKFARTQKGSNRREKARIKVAKCHRKSKNSRKDFHQKTSSQFIAYNSAIIVEDLNVEGMAKNHKVAKHIQDAGWGDIRRMLKYKCEWNGKHFIKVDRFYPSSKTCSTCGKINYDLSRGDKEWECIHCGMIHHRDCNAALNLRREGILKLKTEGHSVSARGGIVSPTAALRQLGRACESRSESRLILGEDHATMPTRNNFTIPQNSWLSISESLHRMAHHHPDPTHSRQLQYAKQVHSNRHFDRRRPIPCQQFDSLPHSWSHAGYSSFLPEGLEFHFSALNCHPHLEFLHDT